MRQFMSKFRHNLTDRANISGLVDAALEIANGRRETLRRLREALEAEDNTEALKLARKLCGLDDEESYRTDPRLN